ncbi:hypothetical protein SS50377_28506 [Spironucleus salmonicida]|uniref:Uncharacterized protein n=1 Tax=Spironucleus salmonicida TaxID=348837 RepID=V6LE56_9EUKA|nr:hypothetical protein SS50377_28506 [Spironucleus salmonicida]|eukprot:EST42752.1 hypothetical protein SS50377_17610 [Spironucleus salmonicida]
MSSPNSTQNIPPEISLDNDQTSIDLSLLSKLSFLKVPPTKQLGSIIDAIIDDPNLVAPHMDLSRYLFNRYKAILEKPKSCFTCITRENCLKSLQRACPEPISTDITKILNDSFIKPSQFNFQQQITDYRNMCDQHLNPNVTEVFSGNFKNDIAALKTDIINALNRSVQMLQSKDQELEELKHLTKQLQDSEKSKNSEISDYAEQINQLNRELRDLGAQNQSLQDTFQGQSQVQYQQPIQGQSEQFIYTNQEQQMIPNQQLLQQQQMIPNQQQIVPNQPQLQQMIPQQQQFVPNQQQFIPNQQFNPQYQTIPQQPQYVYAEVPQQTLIPQYQQPQLIDSAYYQQVQEQQFVPQQQYHQISPFLHSLQKLLHAIPTPTLNKTFTSNTFAQSEVQNKPLTLILQETIQILNSNNIIIENHENNVEWKNQLNSQLSQLEIEILNEIEQIVKKSVKIRYEVESQIESEKKQKVESSLESKNQFVHFTSLQTVKSAFQRSIKSLFAMSVPDKSLRQSLGLLNNNELNKIIQASSFPNFSDIDIILQLNELSKTVESGVEETFEQLSDILNNNVNNCVIVPKLVLELAQLSIQLEDKIKFQIEENDVQKKQIVDLKVIIQNEQNFSAEKTQKLIELERNNEQQQTHLNDMKNNIIQLQIENQRISGMEKMIDNYNIQIEQLKFDLSSLQGKESSQQQSITIQQQQLTEKTEQYQLLKQKFDIIKARVQELEIELNQLGNARKEALTKNRELVALARELETQNTNLETEKTNLNQLLYDNKNIIEKNSNLQKLISAGEIETAENRQQMRHLREEIADLKLLTEKQENQLKYLKQDNEKFETMNHKSLQQYNNVNSECEELSKLYNSEKEKTAILGENLDHVSAMNVDLERRLVALTAQNETLKKELFEVEKLLAEQQTQFQYSKQQFEETQTQLNQTSQNHQQQSQKYAVFNAENELLKRENEKLKITEKEMKNQIQSEIEQKQRLVNDLTSQMAVLTTNNSLNPQFKTQDQQLYNDIQQLQQELGKVQKKLKTVEFENKNYIDNIQQITQIQDKLAQKSKKLLLNSNKLKQKVQQFAMSFVRISKCTAGQFEYGVDIADEFDVSSAEIVKIACPTEEFMRGICGLLEKGVENQIQIEKYAQLNNQFQAIRSEKSNFEAQIASVKKENSQLKKQCSAMKDTIDLYGGAASKNARKYENLEQNLDDSFEIRSGKMSKKEGKRSVIDDQLSEISEIARARNAAGEELADFRSGKYDKNIKSCDIKNSNAPKASNSGSKAPQRSLANRAKDGAETPIANVQGATQRYSPSDSTGKDILNIISQYQPQRVKNVDNESYDYKGLNVDNGYNSHNGHSETNAFRRPEPQGRINPVNVQVSSLNSQTPQMATHFDETIRSYQSKNERSLLSGDEKLMIQRLLGHI